MISLRISSGIYKNKKLEVSDTTRPVTERVKHSIFDILGEYIKDSTVLDLFAGSGNLGIEAISRGAKRCVFVEKDELTYNILKKNIKSIGVGEICETFKGDYKKYLDSCNENFDLIFLDPPFKLVVNLNFKKILNILNKDTVIVLKASSKDKLDSILEIFNILESKKIGANTIYFLQKRAEI